MVEGIGSYLQQLRTGKRLTTTQLAQKAGIRRATLSEWQAGKRQPRQQELEAVLNALGASDVQKEQARKRLSTPKNILRLRAEAAEKHQELVETAGMAPHGGDLIRAMRQRKGWTQAMLAEKMGVWQTTIARWERAERWPDTQALHTLCYLLEAREEELTALILGRFSLTEKQPVLTEEVVRAQLHRFGDQIRIYKTRFSPSEYALAELCLLNLMAHAWSLAARQPAARLLLAEVMGEYTEYLFMQRRFGECQKMATRTLDLYSEMRWKNWQTDRTALWLAEASAHCGGQQGLNSAMALLKQWLADTSDATYAAWILRDLAMFKAARGETEEAIALGWESVQRTAEASDSIDYLHRRHDLARILLQADRAQEAQEVVGASDLHPYFTLVRAETYHGTGEQAWAHHLVAEVMAAMETAKDITLPEIVFYRPVVETLAEQLEGAEAG